jgi:fructose-specific PTS system IIA-like component
MPLKRQFICRLPNGVHARPASSLEEAARGFSSELILFNERTGRTANSKSVLSIISADIRFNDRCLLTVSGSDEREAMAALTTFVETTFPECDEVASPSPELNGTFHLPHSLRRSSVKIFNGVPAVSGVGRGCLLQMDGFKVPVTLRLTQPDDIAAEAQMLEGALQKLGGDYEQRLALAKKEVEKEIIKAHSAIARDPEFRNFLFKAVKLHSRTVAGAITDAERHFSGILAGTDNALVSERISDIQDVCVQLIRQAYGDAAAGVAEPSLKTDTIVMAETMTPSQFLSLDRAFLKGLVLGHTGATSHTIILARSFGIPTLTGMRDLAGAQLVEQEAIIDAYAGALLTNLTDEAMRYYALECHGRSERQARVQRFALQPATTKDGCRIEVAANIASAEEIAGAFAAGAEAIGLFRTEMLFLDRKAAPSEEEQFELYSRVVVAAKGRPVIMRTLDVGGDKALGYLNRPVEENPFLGCRAVRLYRGCEEMFRDQVRALVRASARGALKVMIPMVAVPEEVRWVRKIISEEQSRCLAQKVPFDAQMPLGAMIEVPAAAFAMDALGAELDFFSIGSNDLLQYFMAADRTNAQVSSLYNPLEPAFLRFLKQIADHAQAHEKWLGLCGEMGGQAQFLPLLIGLGINEISVPTPALADLKAEMSALKLVDCQNLLGRALGCATADQVAGLIGNFVAANAQPLIDSELILINADARTREEAIQVAVNRLYGLGRTKNSRAIEEAVWEREQTYSTGFGHGFAIPHCKTNSVLASSLVLVQLRAPVNWDSLDGQPVRVVILLAVREADGANGHMKLFARLARKVMNEDFRARLEAEKDPEKLCEFLHAAIDP